MSLAPNRNKYDWKFKEPWKSEVQICSLADVRISYSKTKQ